MKNLKLSLWNVAGAHDVLYIWGIQEHRDFLMSRILSG